MSRQIIFIGGIHGVGKGTICKDICSSYNFIHLSASDLLKWREVSEDETNKKVADIQNTQDRLLSGLNATIREGKKYLLDGHFCLLNADGNPEKISADTFIRIAPTAISVVLDEVEVIAKRLAGRDSKKYDLNILNQLQLMENEYAENILVVAGVPRGPGKCSTKFKSFRKQKFLLY